jgi:hypothetical protein
MSSGLVRVNVCAEPSGNARSNLVRLAKSFAGSGQIFAVDGATRLPHLTILMLNIEEHHREEYISRLRSSPVRGPINCTAYGITFSSNGFVEIGYNKSDELEDLQERTWQLASGLWCPDLRDDEQQSPLEREYVSEFGYKLFDDLYRPHVTLAAYDRLNRVSVPEVDDLSAFDFSFDQVSVGLSDQFGSLVRVVDRIPMATDDGRPMPYSHQSIRHG